jgi:hypothetical protein
MTQQVLILDSIVRRKIEQLDQADKVHLSYVIGGSGGAGLTVMRSTFLRLQRPFKVWINGKAKGDRQIKIYQQLLPHSICHPLEASTTGY